jgi:DNA repair exonuclease SbcCD nuclease subunit
MKIVHIADLHLGFRQFQRLTPTGLNQREADVAHAFKKAIDRIIELKPDVILVAGDVFHAVRPTNPAILQAYFHFSRLKEELPDTLIVMIAGNHDTPRTVETGSILSLFKSLGITVVESDPKSIFFEDRGLHVYAVPDGTAKAARIAPLPQAKHNVLLIHAEVEGVINRFSTIGERSSPDLSMRELAPEKWDYVALGHYHVYRQVAPNAYYSGATEYTSTNVWGEVDEQREKNIEGKGFVEHDLETGSHRFHPIYLSRTVIDIPEVSAVGLTASELSDAIALAVDKCDGGIDDRIVRLIVRDVPRHILRDLDHRKIREYKRRALNFLLDARRPIPPRIETGSGAPGRRASLTETVRLMLEARPVTPGIDRKALVDLGLKYLDEVDRLAPAVLGDDA